MKSTVRVLFIFLRVFRVWVSRNYLLENVGNDIIENNKKYTGEKSEAYEKDYFCYRESG